MQQVICLRALSIFVVIGLMMLSAAGCSRDGSATALTGTAVAKTPPISADDLIAAINNAASDLKTAKTSVQRDDIVATVNNIVQEMIAGKELRAEFVIRDVKMVSANTARISVSSIYTPLYDKQPKSISISLAGTWDLPITTENARTIEPGQHLILQGTAGYSPTSDFLQLAFPRPHTMARITYLGNTGGAIYGGVLTLAPKKFNITKVP